MSTTKQSQTNGRQRKTLAAQIDRLDAILDGLGEALNEAVADAVRQTVEPVVREAVLSVLDERLSDPELLRRLRPETPQPGSARRWLLGLQAVTQQAAHWLGRRLERTGSASHGT